MLIIACSLAFDPFFLTLFPRIRAPDILLSASTGVTPSYVVISTRTSRIDGTGPPDRKFRGQSRSIATGFPRFVALAALP